MASSLSKLVLYVALAVCMGRLMTTCMAAAEGEQLAARLQAVGMTECWDSLMELRSCTGEVILFFLNGQAYLGPSCCRAIRVIEHRCWAADALLAALGFTAEEGDVLRGFCDAEEDDDLTSPPPPSAARAPAVGVGGILP